ncbi:hypothetical protein ACTG16_22605 [Aeromonas sp. 23P]|uniref:hypothetical protein n=1 Tax=Aeromonas sp. 23P TaxID=3452716 RepID=UPI003F79F831|nr:hypothetical protein [Aeromonas veronii]
MNDEIFKKDVAHGMQFVEVFCGLTPVADGFSLAFNGDSYPFTLTSSVTRKEKTVRGNKVISIFWAGTADRYSAVPKADGSGYQYGEEAEYTYTTDKSACPRQYCFELTIDEAKQKVTHKTKIGCIKEATGNLGWREIHQSPVPRRQYRFNPHL